MEPKIFKVRVEYYIKASSFDEVEEFVGEEWGLDFYEKHIIIDEINEDDMLNQEVDEDLT